MPEPVSRKVNRVVGRGLRTVEPTYFSFRHPSKPPYWSDLLPRNVKYAGGNPNHIQRVLRSIVDKSTLDKTLVILADPDDPKRPLFVITTLRSNWFPRGYWCAYLYHAPSFHSDDYRLIGRLSLYLEPYQIPPWLTWRFLARHLRATQPTPTKRKLRKPYGLLIDPGLDTIALLYGEEGEQSRLGLSESTKACAG